MKRSEVLKLRKIIESAVQSLPDETALQAVTLHPEWASNVSYAVGFKAQRGGKLWRVLQEHTSQDGWQPENAASLWEQINEKHSGALDRKSPVLSHRALVIGTYQGQMAILTPVREMFFSMASTY